MASYSLLRFDHAGPPRCRVCRRVFLRMEWAKHEEPIRGEFPALCPLHFSMEAARQRRERMRTERELDRRMGQGYGAAADDVEVFRGFGRS